MTQTMSGALTRAKARVGKANKVGYCLEECVVNVYQIPGPWRWGGNGKPWALNFWLAAVAHGKVVKTSNPADVPAGAMVFWDTHFGHVAIGAGGGYVYSTDRPANGKWGHVTIASINAAWGKHLLGYILVTGDGVDLRDKAAAAAKPPVTTPPAKVVPTWNQPETWKVGGVSADVKRLADRLVVHGFEDYYGNGTDTTFSLGEDVVAIKAFQTAQGWTGGDADGYPGMQTFALLEADPVAAKPAVTQPALRPPRATGAAPAKIPSSMSKMYHVASSVWYAVEDSIYGLEAAEAGGYPWADIDIHVTKDGVMVCGHDTSPSDDHFVISAAMKKKYGSHPNIENMTWADVATLRTPPVKFGGKTITLRYYKVDEILAWLGEHPKMSVSFELKQSLAFEKPATFEALRDSALEHGVDPKRLTVMSIARPAYNHLARFKAAHAYFKTIVLPHDLAKPAGWSAVEPYVDYYRGSWA